MSCSCCAHNHEVTQSHDEHKHHHENNHNKSGLIKIIISTVFLLFAFLLNHFFQLNFYLKLASFLLPYLIIGFSVIKEAVENIFHKEFFDENFLMTVATVVAFVIGEYPEAVLVMLLSQIGEFFEEMASEKARKSISEMMDIKPDFANLLENETIKKVNPEIVKIGKQLL
jgi:Cd2+/Zn2+-exporting ATPase